MGSRIDCQQDYHLAVSHHSIVEYNLSNPLEFQEGDILGVYQPQIENSALVVYYQERDGPVNYRNISKSALFDVTLLGGSPADNQYDYPLVTVEISTGIRQLTHAYIKLLLKPYYSCYISVLCNIINVTSVLR